MAILELGIVFMQDPLVETQYYTANHRIDKNVRMSLLQSLDSITSQAFGEELSSFSLGEFTILTARKKIAEPANPSHTEDLLMYSITDKETNEKVVKQNMDIALEQFVSMFHLVDIFNKKTKKFKDFDERLKKIFKDLILKNEDRFKSLF
jgi:hypothetical protein